MASGWRTAAASVSALCILALSGCGGAGDSKAPTDGQPAVVSILDATVTEGALNNGTTLTLTNPEGVFCRIAYATRPLTAQSPDDFEAVPSTIMQFGGVPNTPLSLNIVDDNLVEPDETFQVVIALAAGSDPRCQLGKSVATITVVSNDAASVVSIANATINEATGGQALISMTNPTGRTCAVTVTSANGTAVAPADYTALNAVPFTLTGVGSLPVTLATANDTLVESPETFTLTIALAPGSDQQCQLGQATATVTINSDDAAAVISIADATVTEGAAGNQTTISMTNAVAGLSCPLTVTTANGTAVAPGDYTAKAAEAFTLDAASKTLPLAIVNDLNVETAETFTVTIALAPGADSRCQIGRATATITIVSDDLASVISIGDVTVAEGAIAQLPITMTNATGVTCALTATTANGTAVAPADFTALAAAPLSINAVASTTLSVTTIDDAVPELSKSFTVTIALATNADPRCQIADGQATVTITNNDFAVVSIGNITVSETVGTAQVPVTMTNGAGITCNVTASTTNGTATAGLDYTALAASPKSIVGVGATTNDSVGVPILNDTLIEPNETFTVTLALAAGADARCQLGAATATVTIVSDDLAAVISIGNITVNEAVGTAQVPVTMTNANGVTCNLTASTANGTATAGQDYTALNASTLSIVGTGTTATANVGVPILNDILIETDEAFTVTLALAAGSDTRCQLGTATATVTITSDDVAAVISIADANVIEGGLNNQTTISMTNVVAGLSCPLTVTATSGTATAGLDFLAPSTTLTVSAASTTLPLTILADALPEAAETFTITIALAGGADARCQIGDGSATITILANP